MIREHADLIPKLICSTVYANYEITTTFRVAARHLRQLMFTGRVLGTPITAAARIEAFDMVG